MPPSRTIDVRVTQHWPLPVALAWHRVLQARDASLRAQAAGAAAEALLRTVCAVALADHLGGGVDERVGTRLPTLDRPSLGHWVALARELARVSGERGGGFIPELHAAFFDGKSPSDASRTLDEVVTARNKIAHGAGTSEAEVAACSETMVMGLRVVMEAWGWLGGYRLFRVRSERRTRRGTVEGQLQFFAGRDTTPEGIPHEWEGDLVADALYVANPEGTRVLEVSPMLAVRTDPGVRDERLYLLKETVRGKKVRLVNEETGHAEEDGVVTEKGSMPWDAWIAAPGEHPGPIAIVRGAEGFRAPGGSASHEGDPDLGGRYQVREVLGEGAMGIVLRVWDPAWNQEYAVKVSRAEISADASFRERFRREAMTMRSIRHPHVLSVEDVFDLPDGRVCIKMPIIDGGSLEDKVVPGGQPEATVLRWGRQTLDALAHLHAQGIVHRDIKPGNILLDSSDNVRITDFGVALRDSDARLTRVAESLGTSAYMAPEQARAGARVSGKADVYALALVLHELRTGDRKGGVPGKGIAGPLGKLLRAMGHADADERMDATAALAGLDAILAPGQAGAPAEPPPAASPAEGTSPPVTATIAPVQPAEAPSAPSESGARRTPVLIAAALALVGVLAGGAWLLRGPSCSLDGSVLTGDATACEAHAATLPPAQRAPLLAALCTRDAATGGEPVRKACAAGAEAYAAGTGVEATPARAVELRAAGCTAGDLGACKTAGAAYATGQGVAQDMAAAARLWAPACEGGEAATCRGLGVLYLEGMGVPKDPAKGASLLERACAGKDAKACFQLAQLLEGTTERARMAGFYKQACDLEDALGCMNLGVMTVRGDGVPADRAAGEALRAKACSPSLPEACAPLP